MTVDQITAMEVSIQAWEKEQQAKQRQRAAQAKDGTTRGHKKVPINLSEPFTKPKGSGYVPLRLPRILEYLTQSAASLNVRPGGRTCLSAGQQGTKVA